MTDDPRCRALLLLLFLGTPVACAPATVGARPTIAAGGGHSCRLLSGGSVECWGSNTEGQLGIGRTTLAVTVAAPVGGLSGVTAIAASIHSHSCAVLAGGAVSCWGANSLGQLGNGSANGSATPVATGVTGAVEVAAGSGHSCAVTGGGNVFCWGDNSGGQLGNGGFGSSRVPVQSLMTGASRVAAGLSHTCAIANGTVSCWGNGWLGNGSSTQTPTPTAVTGLPKPAVVVQAGATNTCVLLNDQSVWCWGANSHGELGNGTTNQSPTPVQVSGVTQATAISVGGSHACAVVGGGAVVCWGDNSYGQLGDAVTSGPHSCNGSACSSSPVAVAALVGAVDVAAGDTHTCAILSDDRVKCWGWNGLGQLGNGTWGNGNGFPRSPFPVFASRKALAAAGDSSAIGHTCAVLPGGTIKCWGGDGDGQLGNGATPSWQTTPVLVSGITNGLALAAGGDHTCAILGDSSVRCWGMDSFGQVGLATLDLHVPSPVIVNGLVGVGQLGAGRLSTCAVQSGISGPTQLYCFGVNNNGQLGVSGTLPMCNPPGLGFGLPCATTPTPVGGVEPVMLAGGAEHTCAVLTNGHVSCWGQNLNGQLGRTSGNGFVPGDVQTGPPTSQPLSGAVAIAVGNNHNCALLADATVTCWGANAAGQLGNGSDVDSTSPVPVPNLTNVNAIVAGSTHTCALLADGSVKCWGGNDLAQLGTTTGTGTCPKINGAPCSKSPVAVSGISTATMLAAGVAGAHTCAALADGSVWCWGSNAFGELGRGTNGGTAGPAAVVGL
jgi:alpha-tubulin suppressor-like RCC1 family protein